MRSIFWWLFFASLFNYKSMAQISKQHSITGTKMKRKKEIIHNTTRINEVMMGL